MCFFSSSSSPWALVVLVTCSCHLDKMNKTKTKKKLCGEIFIHFIEKWNFLFLLLIEYSVCVTFDWFGFRVSFCGGGVLHSFDSIRKITIQEQTHPKESVLSCLANFDLRTRQSTDRVQKVNGVFSSSSLIDKRQSHSFLFHALSRSRFQIFWVEG
jgi:hypothetical protein